jgi:agmatine deiminase
MPQPRTVLPAEWAPQAAILLTWPHPYSDWLPWLAAVEQTFTTLAVHISQRQRLVISCYDDVHRQHVQAQLAAAGAQLDRVRLYRVPSNDAWARDHGPITVYRNGAPVLLKFRFNGWGDKFPADLDDRIGKRLHALGAFADTPLEGVDLILEGGSIESDGQGTLLTTRHCLLSPQRNALGQAELEQRLRELLGIERFLWLAHGHLEGDDTDSHIDTLARFCTPDTIACQACDDPSDPHFGPLQAMAAELAAFRTAAGRPYRLVPLPLPRPRYAEDGRRLPAGYANFLILNGAVLVPTATDPADAVALARLQDCFPDREIIAVPCLSLLQQYGSLHCVTMQLPIGVRLPS